jgi:hypothetical protein
LTLARLRLRRRWRFAALVQLACRTVRYRADSVVSAANYDAIVKGRLPSNIDHPYFLCFYNLIHSFAEFMNRKGIDGTVDWVFDEGGPIKSEAAVCWYYWVRENAPERIRQRLGSTPIFRDDTHFLPLKAADLNVWHLRRHLAKEQPKGQQHGGTLRR